jgi:signal transduction histidine kinase
VVDSTPEDTKRVRPEVAVALFRVAQEALNNILKHARAKHVRIEVFTSERDIMLEVHDDGLGFDPLAAPRGRWGMTTMRERVQAAGGELRVESAPGAGTRVVAKVPL